MKWEYFSKRRRISLEKFLEGAKTLEEALSLFAGRAIDPPHDKLVALFTKKSKPVVQEVISVEVTETEPTKKKKNSNYAKKQSNPE